MKQWFFGRFEGHYKGVPTRPSALTAYQDAEHFTIEVYEAIVSDLELGELVPSPEPPENPLALEESASPDHAPGDPTSERHLATQRRLPVEPSFHHQPQGRRFFQEHVPRAYLVDALQVGTTVRAALHQVLVSDLEFSFPARHGEASYGRVEGTISGWFRPPKAPPEPLEEPAPPVPRPVGWESDTIGSPSPRETDAPIPALRNNDVRFLPAYPAGGTDESGEGAEPWTRQGVSEDLKEASVREAADYPFFTAGALVIGLMGFAAEPKAAAIFGSVFLFAYGLRRWLSGVVPDVSGVRFAGFFLGALQAVVTAWLISSWSQHGCVALSPLPLLLLVGTMLVTSVLPKPLAFAVSSACFALVMLQAYGAWAAGFCS